MKPTTTAMIMVLITLLFLASTSFAKQERRPVDTPEPAEPACPTTFIDTACTAYGQASNAVFAWALSQAGYSCDDKMSRCVNSEVSELADNITICETVPGCKLTYAETYDACEKGGADNCTPAPGDPEPNPPSFTCTINGEYNITGYSCARPPKTVTATSTI